MAKARAKSQPTIPERAKYHRRALDGGLPMFGPTDLESGRYELWLKVLRKDRDRAVELFNQAMEDAVEYWQSEDGREKWERDPSGQQQWFLDQWELPPAVVKRLEKLLERAEYQPLPVHFEAPKGGIDPTQPGVVNLLSRNQPAPVGDAVVGDEGPKVA